MLQILVSLWPFILGKMLIPLHLIIVILLLKNPHQGMARALAFIAGGALTRLVQGVLFGVVFYDPDAASGPDGSSPVVSTLLLVLGVILLISAVRKLGGGPELEDDEPHFLFTSLDLLGPFKAFWLGAGLVLLSPKMWVFTLSALSEIGAAQPGLATGALVYLLFILLVQALLLMMILICLLLPDRSQAFLQAASEWLSRNNRMIMIVVSLVFGVYFLVKGVTGLMV